MTSSPIIAAELFETLANDGINIDMINAGISRISVVIDGKKVQDAVISMVFFIKKVYFKNRLIEADCLQIMQYEKINRIKQRQE